MIIIANTSKSETVSLLNRLTDAIKDISGDVTSSYSHLYKHKDMNLWAVKIVPSGFYWNNVKEALTENEINEIEYSNDNWDIEPTN